MLVAPPDVIAPSFGVGSLTRHLAAAEAFEVDCTVVTAPGLMLDVDTPADHATLIRATGASQTREFCDDLGLEERLAALSTG
jgi:2-phospho-L-lactate guanylyltransferase (CobY/MobA/RfbA family)